MSGYAPVYASRPAQAEYASAATTEADERHLHGLAQRLSHVGHWEWEVATGALTWSDEIFRILGYEPQSFAPRLQDGLSAYHPEDQPLVQAHLERAVREASSFTLKLRLIRRDGALRHVSATGFCRIEDGRVLSMFGVLQDITELVDAQQLAREAQHRFQLAAEAGGFGVFDLDLEVDELVWDERMYAMYGLDKSAFSGAYQAWESVLHPADRERAAQEVLRALDGETFDTRFRIVRPKDGEVRHIQAHAVVLRDPERRPIRMIGVNQDITARVDREDRFRSALRELPVGCLFVDARGQVEFANSEAEAMFAYETGGLSGTSVATLFPAVVHNPGLLDPSDRTSSTLTLRRDVVGIKSDGSQMALHIGVGVFDSGKHVTRLLSLTDLTEQKSLQVQLAHSQRMEAVGQLAGGIAHDFNNLLSVLIGHTEFLSAVVGSDEEAQESVRVLRHVGQRGAALTRRLLAYSRKQPLNPEIVSVTDVLHDLGSMLRRILPEGIELQMRFDPSLGLIEADRHQLEDALMILAVNAKQAMPQGGQLVIEAGNAELGEGELSDETEAIEAGPYIAIVVRDTGEGMSETVRNRAFEPFFTTKPIGEGTGLGLSMVYGFVRQSKGHVSIETDLGLGTSIYIYLPRIEVEPQG